MSSDSSLLRKARRRGLAPDDRHSATHHVVLCTGTSCGGKEGDKAWKALDRAARDLEDETGHCVLRTRTDCLKLCRSGPLAVVYPEGTWYEGVTPKVAEKIVRKHIGRGKEVKRHVFARQPLGPADD